MIEGFEYTQDWFSRHIPAWTAIFKRVEWDATRPHTVVELGCFEGRSTVWILQNLVRNADSRVFCVDDFTGGPEYQRIDFAAVRARFDANVRATGKAAQVEVLAGSTWKGLTRLLGQGVQADFVYVDASHTAPDTLEDLVLSYRLLRVGGVLVCDDYLYTMESPGHEDVLNAPKIAVDAFSTIYARTLSPFPRLPVRQVAWVKRATEPGPAPRARSALRPRS